MLPTLSVVIPAFNEALRIAPYLAEMRRYLDATHNNDYEVVVVDDGSTDDTARLVTAIEAFWPQLRLLRLSQNRGKGAAVRAGVFVCAGSRVLFADADGATPIAEEARLADAIRNGAAMACGSRVLPGEGVTRQRHFRRAITGGLFAWAARRLLGVRLRDTQCGFKMFTAAVAQSLFEAGEETGYLFDLELLAIAARMRYPVAEVPVSWTEQPGSKVRLFRDSFRMFRGLWRLRRQLHRRDFPLPVPVTGRAAA